ncbi:MAG TPA: nucleotidyltransferase domain-containing protein [Acidimicrobiales bacterium]|nr:nucleotidyltransferase domain-containing protein [Acidimicrobiales bacterium]
MDFRRPVQAVIPGVQGQVLAVLAVTETELTMRTVAKLAGVSVNRGVTVLNDLVELGIVRRRDAGRSALVSLDRENEVGRMVASLAAVRSAVIERLRRTARSIRPQPASLVLFGSLATGTADTGSDVDVVAVRRAGVDVDEEGWLDSLGAWGDRSARIVGNPVNFVVVGEEEVAELLSGRQRLWRKIAETGIVLAGFDLAELGKAI